MRSVTILLITGLISLFFMNVTAQDFSTQSIGGNELKQPVSLSEALSKLAEEYKVHILYDDAIVEKKFAAIPTSSGLGLGESLTMVLDENLIGYEKVGNKTIVLTALESAPDPEPQQVSENKLTIRGFVFDSNTDEPLVGANVMVKGMAIGGATDLDGGFSLDFETEEEFTLIIVYVGYKTIEKKFSPADNLSNLSIGLSEDLFRTEEIVVTGVASKTSKSVAEIAVSRVSASELTEIQTYQELSQLITGKVAGVRIEPASGNVGSGIRFNMRSGGGLNGEEQPVIYVDGIRIDGDEYEGTGVGGQGISLLADLNPEDIANVEILKGPAAAASYGTNGSNGVVLITTKRGQVVAGGTKSVSLNYKMLTGFNTQSYDYSKDDYVNATRMNGIHHDGQILQHSLNASGGMDNFRYYLGLDRRYEEGILVNNHLDRKTLRANFDVFPNEEFSISASSSYSITENRRPEGDNNSYSWIGQTYKDNPPYPSIDSLAITKINNTINSNRFIGSLQAHWTPFQGFGVNGSFGIDNYDLIDIEHYPYGYIISGHDEGRKTLLNRQNRQFTYQADAQYKYIPYSNLAINSVVGTQIFDRRIKSSGLTKEYFLTELITDIGAGAEYGYGSEGLVHYREAGIFTEHSLAYLDQYYFSFMIRKDYASTIGKKAPSIIYPRASFALRLDKYSFLPTLFDMMKFRIAYGETGVLPGRRDAVRLLWYGDNSAYGVGAQISRIGNEALKPERVKELEFGFDAELFRNYSVEFTYYKQNAEDAIFDKRLSPSQGYFSIPFNIGKLKGWGIESLIQARPLHTSNFQIDLSLTYNYQTNKVLDLGEEIQEIYGSRGINVITEGQPKHAFYGYKLKGALFNTNGTYQGADWTDEKKYLGTPIPPYSGSFTLNARIFKNFNINVMMDWATGHSILNYTLKKASSYSTIPRQRELERRLGYEYYYTEPDYYKGEDVAQSYMDIEPYEVGSPEYIAAANEYAKYSYYNENFIEPADFLKLRELSISYRFTDLIKEYLTSQYISDLILGFSARNLWITTKYSGPSSEMNYSGTRSLNRGVDFYTLQLPRVYNFWLRISL